MDIYIDIAIIILCLSVTVLCWYLVAAINKSRKTLTQLGDTAQSVQREIVDLNARLAPILDDINTVTTKVRRVAENVDTQMDSLKTTVKIIGDIIQDIRNFEVKIIKTAEDPFSLLGGVGKAAIKGIKAFIEMMRND